MHAQDASHHSIISSAVHSARLAEPVLQADTPPLSPTTTTQQHSNAFTPARDEPVVHAPAPLLGSPRLATPLDVQARGQGGLQSTGHSSICWTTAPGLPGVISHSSTNQARSHHFRDLTGSGVFVTGGGRSPGRVATSAGGRHEGSPRVKETQETPPHSTYTTDTRVHFKTSTTRSAAGGHTDSGGTHTQTPADALSCCCRWRLVLVLSRPGRQP